MATSSHRISKGLSQSDKKDEPDHKLKEISCSQQKKDLTILKKPVGINENFNIDQNIFIQNIKSNEVKKRVQSDLSADFKDQIDYFNKLSALSTNKRQVFGELQNQPKESISLIQKKSGKIFKFPIYEENEIQYPPDLIENINQPYDDDDDIDTRQSVVNYFINVCFEDLTEGLKMQRDKKETNKQVNNNIFQQIISNPIKEEVVNTEILKDNSIKEQQRFKNELNEDQFQESNTEQINNDQNQYQQQECQKESFQKDQIPRQKSDSKVHKIGSKK